MNNEEKEMTELITPETAMPQSAASLSQATDDELRVLIDKASGILQEREIGRMRDAVASIKALAKEHGLNVSIDSPAKKRGRPPANARHVTQPTRRPQENRQ